MKIEIDQSGHIEYTNKPTVVGFSNKKSKTLIISAVEKQKIQRYFRKINKPRLFTYTLFALFIFLILKKEKNIEQIIIDTEYPGQDVLIKGLLLNFFKREGIQIDKRTILFRQIGKRQEFMRSSSRHTEQKEQISELLRVRSFKI